MDRRAKLLVLLVAIGGLYLLSRTKMGQTVTGNITDKIARLIFGEEGERLDVYPDIGGKWTVGKGHLILSTDRVLRNGKSVALYPFGPRDPANPDVATGVRTITQAESDAFFARDTEIARNAVANKVAYPLTDNMRAALSSLVFNIGTGAFGTSTLLRMLNAGNVAGAADQFLVWKKVNGVDSSALLDRRRRERALFLS